MNYRRKSPKPAGNVWPAGNKSQIEIELSSYELTGWVHPLSVKLFIKIRSFTRPNTPKYSQLAIFNQLMQGNPTHTHEKSLWNGNVLLSDRVGRPYVSCEVRRAAPGTLRTSGRMVYNLNLRQQQGNVFLETSEMKPGLYGYRLVVDGKHIDNKKMMVLK
jgi:hypothetical protein